MPSLNTPFLLYKTHWSHSAWIWACLFLAIIPTDREQEGRGQKRGLEAGLLWQRRQEQTVERPSALHDRDRISSSETRNNSDSQRKRTDKWERLLTVFMICSMPIAWTSKLLVKPCLSAYSLWSVWGEPPVFLVGIKPMLCKLQQFVRWLNISAVWLG